MKRQLTREERRRRRRLTAVVDLGYAAIVTGCLLASIWLPAEMLRCLVVLIMAGGVLALWNIWGTDN